MAETLDYERVIDLDTGNIIGYYSEGHVDKDQFAHTILEEEEKEISTENIRHGYMRQSPLQEDDCTDYAQYRLDFQNKQLDGWNPVTYWGEI